MATIVRVNDDDSDFDVGPKRVSSDKLEKLYHDWDEAAALTDLIAQQEEDLKAAKRTLHQLITRTIPDQMIELEIEKQTRNGWSIELRSIVEGSLPKDPDARDKAIKWLEDHEASSLIKSDVKMSFGRDQYTNAQKLVSQLRGKGLEVVFDTGVHPQTLCAFARERLASGDPIDLELLGLFSGYKAKFKRV